jgi:sugar lactone lactonase YvrE
MNDKAELFVDSRCELGEGPFWHPLLKRLFWFDILNQTLLSATTDGHLVDRITFKDFASAAAVVDENTLAVVQSGVLLRYSFDTDTSTVIDEIEDNPANRSNDSRMDRSGGFWIGTMNRGGGAPRTGSVYQWKAGRRTTILTGIAVPNSICFSPDGTRAYFTDAGRVIRTVTLDPATGLPNGEWTDFFSGTAPGGADGSVVDSEGFVWNARWGGSCVIRFSPDGEIDRIIDVPGVSRVSCPAFGGDDMKTLYLTTARENMPPGDLEREPTAGSVYSIRVDVPGIVEPFLAL